MARRVSYHQELVQCAARGAHRLRRHMLIALRHNNASNEPYNRMGCVQSVAARSVLATLVLTTSNPGGG